MFVIFVCVTLHHYITSLTFKSELLLRNSADAGLWWLPHLVSQVSYWGRQADFDNPHHISPFTKQWWLLKGAFTPAWTVLWKGLIVLPLWSVIVWEQNGVGIFLHCEPFPQSARSTPAGLSVVVFNLHSSSHMFFFNCRFKIILIEPRCLLLIRNEAGVTIKILKQCKNLCSFLKNLILFYLHWNKMAKILRINVTLKEKKKDLKLQITKFFQQNPFSRFGYTRLFFQ